MRSCVGSGEKDAERSAVVYLFAYLVHIIILLILYIFVDFVVLYYALLYCALRVGALNCFTYVACQNTALNALPVLNFCLPALFSFSNTLETSTGNRTFYL